MAFNRAGEFEIVLGNKQLLSVFFVLVVLFTVFFTMGYVLGRNSLPESAQAASPAPAPASVEVAAAPVRKVEVPAAPPEVESISPGTPPASGDKPSPMPAGDGSGAVAPSQPQTVQPPAATASITGAAMNPPAKPGETYLQVAATKKSEADLMAEVLAKKGFSTTVSPAPNTELYRVLVGPIADSLELEKLRTRLKEIGLDPIIRKL